MTSISAVKMALERGNTEDALYLLRKILKTNPSAEAFYLAGKLAPNRVMAKKFLKQSLQLEPNYEPSTVLLQVLDLQEQHQTAELRQEMLDGLDTGPLGNSQPSKKSRQGILKRLVSTRLS